MSNPFAMSFDDLKAQADMNMKADKGQPAEQPAVQPTVQPGSAATSAGAAAPQPQTGTGKSFLDMVNEAERQLAENEGTGKTAESAPTPAKEETPPVAGIPSGISFDDMFSQAQGGTAAGAPSFEDLFNQATNNQAAQTAAQPTAQPAAQPEKKDSVQETVQAPLSFEEMLAQAQAQTNEQPQSQPPISFDDVMNQPQEEPKAENQAPAEEPKAENQAPAEEPKAENQALVEEPKAENQAPVEEPKTEETPAEEPKTEETPAEEPKAKETPAEESKAEEQAPVKKDTTKKSGKKTGKAKEEKEPAEPLPDTTNDYKVDLTGGVAAEEPKVAPEVKSEGGLSMETLFTPEEISAFRTDIRTFVRSEFKKAMVGAMKDMLADFSE